MKRRFFHSLALIMILAACQEAEKAGPASAVVPADSSLPAARQDTMPVAGPPKDSLKTDARSPFEHLPGNWALLGDDNTSFVIEKKKITYPSTFKSYPYAVKGDSVKIRYDDYEGSFRVTMRGRDTLVLTGDEAQVYYRVKQ